MTTEDMFQVRKIERWVDAHGREWETEAEARAASKKAGIETEARRFAESYVKAKPAKEGEAQPVASERAITRVVNVIVAWETRNDDVPF